MSLVSEFLKEWRKAKPQQFMTARAGETEYNFEPGIEAGATVTMGGQPVADGEITLDDGTKIMCLGGIITAIEKPAATDDMAAIAASIGQEFAAQVKVATAPMTKLQQDFAALQKTNEAAKTELEAVRTELADLKKFVDEKKQQFTALDLLVEKMGADEGKQSGKKETDRPQTKAEKIAAMVQKD